MNSEKAFVTIILPVYNAEKHLNEAIDSILHQSYSFFELVLINDGSSDRSEEIILAYSDRRIRYIKNAQNIGLIDTLNLGFSLAQGKYIARMDNDDIALPDRIEKQVAFLESNPNIGLLGSGYTIFGDKNEVVNYPKNNDDLKLATLFYNPFCHPSIILRKQIMDDNNLRFKKEYIHAEEYKLWTELLFLTECHNLEDNLLMYRSHASQISRVHRQAQLEKTTLIQKEYLKNAGFELSDRGFKSIFSIASKSTLNNPDAVLERLESLEKVVKQNEKIHFFNHDKLKQKLSILYKNTILELSKMNKSIYQHYRSSTLSKSIHWTLKQKIRIALQLFSR